MNRPVDILPNVPSTLQFYFPGHSARITLLPGFHCSPKSQPTETTMLKDILRFATLTVLFSCGTLLAQNGAPPSAGNPPWSEPAQTRQEPCWRQAGISRTVMEEHRSIETDAHSQVAGVCGNSSLTPQEKQQQVGEIRQQARQKMDALITPEQQSALAFLPAAASRKWFIEWRTSSRRRGTVREFRSRAGASGFFERQGGRKQPTTSSGCSAELERTNSVKAHLSGTLKSRSVAGLPQPGPGNPR